MQKLAEISNVQIFFTDFCTFYKKPLNFPEFQQSTTSLDSMHKYCEMWRVKNCRYSFQLWFWYIHTGSRSSLVAFVSIENVEVAAARGSRVSSSAAAKKVPSGVPSNLPIWQNKICDKAPPPFTNNNNSLFHIEISRKTDKILF